RYNGNPEDEDPHNPFMDRHSPERYQTPGYQLDDRPYGHDEPLQIPVGPGPYSPQDRLQPQPTYSVENMPGTFGHSEAYEDTHIHQYTPNPYQQAAHHGTGDYSLSPQYEHPESHMYGGPQTPEP
ncbi:hypothetical protein LTR33_019433, partial [Friedmanniomyces endolithicus]